MTPPTKLDNAAVVAVAMPSTSMCDGATDTSASSMITITRKKKKKISTYHRRKAELAKLRPERLELEVLLRNQLRQSHRAGEHRRKNDTDKLRAMVGARDLFMATTMSAVSAFSLNQVSAPFDRYIRLERDLASRRDTILALKPLVIQDAVRFYRERQSYMDLTADSSECRRFQASNGDPCVVSSSVVPFPRATTVKQVFDVLHSLTQHVETTAAEVIGDHTLRENSVEHTHGSATQHRLAASVSNLALMDINMVVFAEYLPDSQLGIIVSHYVDEDELFPYVPSHRMRNDLTLLDVVTKYPSPDGDKQGVTVAQWAYSHFHGSEQVPVSRVLVDSVQRGAAQMEEHKWKSVRLRCE